MLRRGAAPDRLERVQLRLSVFLGRGGEVRVKQCMPKQVDRTGLAQHVALMSVLEEGGHAPRQPASEGQPAPYKK
ncbi:hypothetical protein Acy02nite_92200 [Actinoplanes cyaneus]|uniref:Uncharacterized protein n=1 Tax=Actinoplanes cyaneus TaxID=52696 RepID=A0A919ISI1_9ACTN|nr:hypothetical protein Acy02nite_92200 [Actinoplanes cyaneus]